MGLDMLSLSPTTPAEPVASPAPAATGTTDTGAGESFGAVVERLLEGETPAVETPRPGKMASGLPVQVEKTLAPSATDAEQDANALLLALGAQAQAWFVAPIIPTETAVPAEAAAPENLDVVALAPGADGAVPTVVPMALVSATLPAPVAPPAAAAPHGGLESADMSVPTVEATAGDRAPVTIDAAVSDTTARGGRDAAAQARLPVSTTPRSERTPLEPSAGDTPPAVGQATDAIDAGAVQVVVESVATEVSADSETRAAADVPPPSEPRLMKLSPQGARLAAALAQGERVGAAVSPITMAAAAVEIGRIAVEAARGSDAAAVHAAAASRPLDVALPEQAAPQAVRESATRFLNFDTTVAALAADAFQVRSTSESEFGSSGDASAWARHRGAYDLRSAAFTPALPDLLDGRSPVIVDPRGAFTASSSTGILSESVTPTGSLPAGAHAAMGDVPTQIVRAMHMQWREGTGEAKLTLTPESLGEVTISMKVERGVVTATVRAENPVTMEWIRSHQHELRDALAAQGLKLDRFDVSVDPDGRRQRDEATQQHAARKPRRVANADTPRFELHV